MKSQLEKWQNLESEEGKEAQKAKKEAERVAKEAAKEKKEREKLEDEVDELQKAVEALRGEDAEKIMKDRKALKKAVEELAVCLFFCHIRMQSCSWWHVLVEREIGAEGRVRRAANASEGDGDKGEQGR